jgi:hypothetical protein
MVLEDALLDFRARACHNRLGVRNGRRTASCIPARALEEAIFEYIAVTNEQPRPFRWTKTADEILASVERFCRRISDSRD